MLQDCGLRKGAALRHCRALSVGGVESGPTLLAVAASRAPMAKLARNARDVVMNDQVMLEVLESREQRRQERREFFLAAGGLAVGGAAAAALSGATSRAQAQTAAPSDGDIFNFALNLEYLEANFYSYVTTGAPIAASMTGGTGTPGAATGGRKITFTDPTVAGYANELRTDELGHINFLKSAVGATAIAQPAIDLGVSPTSAFSMAAQSAGIVAAGQSFDPYASDENFLIATFLFVEVGTSAYQGSAGLIADKTNLLNAAGILAVEAYHSGIARTLIASKGIQTPALYTEANGISNARDSLDGSSDDDQGIQLNGVLNLVPTDANSITYPRTAGQILNIAYLNKGAVNKGGFFPNGVNGAIVASTAET